MRRERLANTVAMSATGLMMHGALLTLLALVAMQSVADEPIWLGRFQSNAVEVPPPWRVVQFDRRVPATRYAIREWDGVSAVEAIADQSMALLARPVAVHLHRTPILCWRWRVDAPLSTADMRRRRGDDYAARVYLGFMLPARGVGVVTRGKLGLARSIYGDVVPDAALNYVWDNRYPIGTQAPSAYTTRTRMIVVQSGADNAGRWILERRDVLADLASAFHADARLTVVAPASDTDNTRERAHAGFADLHFVAADMPCFGGVRPTGRL